MKRLLVLTHRYLGIPLSIVFVVWFISGIVMMYTRGFPTTSENDRLAASAPVDFAALHLSAEAAWSQAGMSGTPESIRLDSLMNRPLWTFELSFGRQLRVFGDTGDVLSDVTAQQGAAIAAAWLGIDADEPVYAETLVEPDQWTLLERRQLPMHRYVIDDDAATSVYVSTFSGDVALVTTRQSRFFAWVGVIPHWFYFRALRQQQPWWYRSVVIVSALGCLLAVIGITMIFTQFRRSRPFSLAKSIRYRGWMRWHYYSGALFGVFALTWAFSGLLSVEPFEWTRAEGLALPRDALSGGELEWGMFPVVDATSDAGRILREREPAVVDYVRIMGDVYFELIVPGNDQVSRSLLMADDFSAAKSFTADSIVSALESAAFGAKVTDAVLLEEYDTYYYDRDHSRPLPVLRLKFDDAMESWYYVDPSAARIVGRTHRFARIERWLFNGLHSLDFAFWYDKRPLWDIGMIALSLGALLTSAIGMFLGFRRLLPRKVRNAIK
jgi:uncharacterized iron-regulated membrane protein